MTAPNLWEDSDLIFAYTRTQALEDGVLVDITPWATEAGFKIPVAVTAAVWAILQPSPELMPLGQSVTGRAWDLLMILRSAIHQAPDRDRVHFAPLFVREPHDPTPRPVPLWALCGPGDDGAPVLTVMCEGED